MHLKNHWNWLVCLGLLAATATWGYFSFLPQRRLIQQTLAEAIQKEEHVLASGGLPAALAAAQEELDKTKAFNRDWRKRTGDPRSLTEFYGRIHDAVSLSGATTTRFEPHPTESLETVGRTRFSAGCSGPYRAVHEVLARIEELDVPLRIESLKIGPTAEDAKTVAAEAKVVVFSDNSKNSR